MKLNRLSFSCLVLCLASFFAEAATDTVIYDLQPGETPPFYFGNWSTDESGLQNWIDRNQEALPFFAGASYGPVGPDGSPSPDQEGSVLQTEVQWPETERKATNGNVRKYRLVNIRIGGGVTTARPDYSLGEAVQPPVDANQIDWAASYAASTGMGQTDTLFFDPTSGAEGIYFAQGGSSVVINWVLKNGETNQMCYVVQGVSSSRPYRIFRTDSPYNGSPVSLSGKFTKRFGNKTILTPVYGKKVTTSGGITTTNEHVIVQGVYEDDNQMLYAVGNLEGQFLQVYYDSARYERVLDVIVVEVLTPGTKIVHDYVGNELFPAADGYARTGLLPAIQESDRTTRDGRGDFVYQHATMESYDPHRNSIFALRPTLDESDTVDHTWDAAVDWSAPDSQGTYWPFERTQYSLRWDPAAVTFLRGSIPENPGQPIYFPGSMTVELQPYQTPNGHALSVSNNCFSTRGAGYSLLKLTGPDAGGTNDIAFLCVHSVLASSVDSQTVDVDVGEAARPQLSGMTQDGDMAIDLIGYVYRPSSSLNYDPYSYIEPTRESIGLESTLSDGTEITNSVSEIFLINVPSSGNANGVEVWWNQPTKAGDLRGTFYVPSTVNRYVSAWPDPAKTYQIVLASQKGSGGVSWLNGHAVTNPVIESVTTPVIYTNYPSSTSGKDLGYNPNEEHAFVIAGDGGWVVWAMRCDMNATETSSPLVLVKTDTLETNGLLRAHYTPYYVVPTNAVYPAFEGNMLVGHQLPGPHPFDLLIDPWMDEIYWDDPMGGKPVDVAVFRDRKGVPWARRNGDIPIHMYYRMQEGFDFPGWEKNSIPTNGAPVAWNCTLIKNQNPAKQKPGVWTWHAQWPEFADEIGIGRTLTKAADGLPEIWGAASAAVLYPDPSGAGIGSFATANTTAQLIDPTVKRAVSLAAINVTRGTLMSALGFTTGPNGNAIIRNGVWYFDGLPASLSSRFYYNPAAGITNCLCLVGNLDAPDGGIPMLQVNVLNESERSALRELVPASNKYRTAWETAIDALAKTPVIPSSLGYARRTRTLADGSLLNYLSVEAKYQPIDHYALGTLGSTGYVVWVENDTTNSNMSVKEGDAVSMHVLRVKPEYYLARPVTRSDDNNLLSQLLDVLYTESFVGKPNDYTFEWSCAEPAPNGTVPSESDYKNADRGGLGITRFTLGKQGTLADLVNRYYRVRFRAVEGSEAAKTMGTVWSAWSEPCLAEGWIQRVINAITPFTQRVNDLYKNAPDLSVSMIEQIGGPYQGDVALNQANLSEVGLLQVYQTLLNKAESMSIAMGEDASIDVTAVNKQLMQVVERLSDLYTVLGNEALSDAINPTIMCATLDEDWVENYSQPSTALFCFDNQLPSLLDEELALLRGRSVVSTQTAVTNTFTQAPCYNRLVWNFTRGITAGEVAYAMNYNISGVKRTQVDAQEAAVAYPQGHGDAWGHYLSAMKLWYRLLRNPSFTWSVSMGEMNVNDNILNVDHYEEAKFAEVAADLARTAVDIVDRTARKVWSDYDGTVNGVEGGYEDSVTNRAFGYGEWANKGGTAAFVNWMVVNSLLPAAQTNEENYADFSDQGLLLIDRHTQNELGLLSSSYESIQRKVDQLDAGLNPLGFAENTVPFGLTPDSAAEGTDSHFEQVYDKALTALDNAQNTLAKAQETSGHLRLLANAQKTAEDEAEMTESSYDSRLIAIYGYPYDDDIGVGGTYPQGYTGPDLYHYMWMNASDFGVNPKYLNADVKASMTYKFSGANITASYDFSSAGIVQKPASVTGSRRSFGSIQEAYAGFLKNLWTYQCAVVNIGVAQARVNTAEKNYAYLWSKYAEVTAEAGAKTAAEIALKVQTYRLNSEIQEELQGVANDYESLNTKLQSIPSIQIVGASQSSPVRQAIGSMALKKWSVEYSVKHAKTVTLLNSIVRIQNVVETMESAQKLINLGLDCYEKAAAVQSSRSAAWSGYNAAVNEVVSAIREVSEAAEKVKTLIAQGEQLLSEREMYRRQLANKAAQNRYAEMTFRLLQDEALTTYSQAFDIAQRYTWLAAKAYDYETGGQLATGGTAGRSFLDSIIGARLLGEMADGKPLRWGGDGDPGLSDILARMQENWTVLKPRLGINNPQTETTWFSLRQEAFRIVPGTAGDNAWRNKLASYWITDLKEDSIYRRLCQPVQSTEGTSDKEPALVIPLESTIDFARNFFGNRLAGGDSAFSSTYFATKIYQAGVRFVGYNTRTNGGAVAVLAETPYVWLIPAGLDMMRVPGSGTGEVVQYNVVDQVIPVPNVIGSTALDDDWSTVYNNLTGTSGSQANVRKFAAFRAMRDPGEAENGEMVAKSLIGRSVWNTKWVLIIPAGALRSDREQALDDFIWGTKENGVRISTGVTDIKLGFKTYSHAGN